MAQNVGFVSGYWGKTYLLISSKKSNEYTLIGTVLFLFVTFNSMGQKVPVSFKKVILTKHTFCPVNCYVKKHYQFIIHYATPPKKRN